MGQFDIEKFLEEGRTRMGQMEWIYILLSIFVIFGTNIVLMNAFIGLAVGDVEEVKSVFKNFENLRVLNSRASKFFGSRHFTFSSQKKFLSETRGLNFATLTGSHCLTDTGLNKKVRERTVCSFVDIWLRAFFYVASHFWTKIRAREFAVLYRLRHPKI